MSSSFVEDTAQLNILQPLMFGYLSDVFGKVVPREQTGLGFDGWPTLLERADSGFEMNKALQAVVSMLEYLERNSPVSLVAATKILADGSRNGKLLLDFQAVTSNCQSTQLKWSQNSFGCHSVTTKYWAFTSIFSLNMQMNMIGRQMLYGWWVTPVPIWVRLVTRLPSLQLLIWFQDINRKRALAKLNLPTLLRRLTQEDKADVTLGVLCNLCLDYGTTPYLRSTQLG